MQRFLSSVLLLLLSLALNAGALLPRHRFENVAGSPVSVIVEDQQGVIWVGASDGLFRLDHRQLRKAADRPNVQVHDLWEQRDVGLWIAHEKGIALWRRATDTWENMPCAEQGVRQLIVGGDTLYALSSGAIWHFDLHAGSCEMHSILGLPKQAIEAAAFFNDHWVLAVRDHGLFRCTQPCVNAMPWAQGLQDTRVRLLQANAGSLWVGTHKHGLFQLADSGAITRHWQRSEYPNAVNWPTNGTMSVWLDAERGKLWAGLWAGGLMELRLGELASNVVPRQTGPESDLLSNSRHVPLEASTLGGDNVRAIYQSRSGTLFVGHESGLSTLDPYGHQAEWIGARTPRHAGLERPSVQTVLAQSADIFWVGTDRGGLHRVDLARNTLDALTHDVNRPDSIPSNGIWDSHRGRDGWLWLASSAGMIRVHPETMALDWIGRNQVLPSQDVFRIKQAPDGCWWIGMWEGGVARLSETGQLERIWRAEDGLVVDTVLALEISRDGKIFALNSEGLFSLDAQHSFYRLTTSAQRLSALHIDKQNRLWVGGAGRYLAQWSAEQKAFVPIELRGAAQNSQDASDDPVVQIQSHGNSLFVLSTTQLWRLDLRTQQQSRFGLAAMLGTAVPSDLALLALDEKGDLANDEPGHALVGSSEGVFRVDLTNSPPAELDVVPMIVGVRLFNQPLRLPAGAGKAAELFGNQLSLRYDQDLISFEFATIPVRSHVKLRYRYRLKPFDQAWIEAASDEPRASYTRLPPGEYRFAVQAGSNTGWGSTSSDFVLRVLPPWWLSWWAKALMFLTVFGGAFAVYRFRTRALRQQTEMLERRVQERTLALESANQRLNDVARRDPLTGALNRRGFMAVIDTMGWSSLLADSILLIGDIDCFKSFNDQYGHDVGDEVLIELARRLQKLMLPNDFFARWGGEEFIAILRGPELLRRAQGLQASIAATPMQLSIGERRVSLTAGCVRLAGPSFERCLKQADALLYQGKQEGRDRLICAPELG
jgi:diguanylate cyclase (GGDEF)-like protein